MKHIDNSNFQLITITLFNELNGIIESLIELIKKQWIIKLYIKDRFTTKELAIGYSI
jgi:hypothetical protein